MTVMSVAVVPEWTVAEPFRTMPLNALGRNVTLVLLPISTYPPFSFVSSALPPSEVTRTPPGLTIVS